MILSQDKKTGYWTVCGDGNLRNVHDPKQCEARGCAIHNHPSNHRLRDAPLNWREDRNILERICRHGIGHPDHDAALYLESIGQGSENSHGCDFCCGPGYPPVID